MQKSFILTAIACILLLSSCKHYCHYNPKPMLNFVNFDSSDMNTVIVVSHSTNSGGPNGLPVGTTKIYTSRANHGADTLSFDMTSANQSSFTASIYLDFNTDASIYIPATGKTYNLRNYKVNRDDWESVNCTNSMSYYLNDTLHKQAMQPTTLPVDGIITISK